MIILTITMEILADKQRELEQMIRSMMPKIRQKAGCNDPRWFEDMEQDRFCIFSAWQHRESVEDFIRSDLFSALMGTKILLKEPPSIKIYSVSSQEGNEAVQAIRFEAINIE